MYGVGVCWAVQVDLAESTDPDSRLLATEIHACVRSSPADTDAWVRLFMSSVMDFDQIGVLVCDASLSMCPIIFANVGFERTTGYSREAVVGHSCRFLQGPRTDPDSVVTLAEALRTATKAHVKLINYRKDGTVFLNMLALQPIFDCTGMFRFMVALSAEMTDACNFSSDSNIPDLHDATCCLTARCTRVGTEQMITTSPYSCRWIG